MIVKDKNVFKLSTENTSYWLALTKFYHLEHIYYGKKLEGDQAIAPLQLKRTAQIGSSVIYDASDETYCLDQIPLEWSGIGCGDYRHSPMEVKMPDGSFSSDFLYCDYSIVAGKVKMKSLPASYGQESECQTLVINMKDSSNNVELLLYYCVYPKSDIITRRVVLRNNAEDSLTIRKLLSMSVDMPNNDFNIITLDGGWIKEAHKHVRQLSYGIYVNSSTTGSSSNRHNPGFLLATKTATESSGEVYGFNLVYSGNHYGAVELSDQDIVRTQIGINPYCFEWQLKTGAEFETPEAIMTYSGAGFNKLSKNFHDFINNHIVRGEWKNKERPTLLNNWEATFFRYNEAKLRALAKRAKKLGLELFVLDDGWFQGRDNDKAGLGDYSVNKKKFRRGLKPFADYIHKSGLMFGLWFEPEMVNEDSDLYRAHPEYALKTPNRKPSLGRNQLVLDLCNPAVCDYIVDNVTKIIDECQVDYVKWDYNRHISDAYSALLENQGEFFHRYVQGLYSVLERIFGSRPHILFESCSSGGNRFDLGMLCFSPQIWTSDNTDPIERLKIQAGISQFYPLSTMGAHVSDSPHQQTLRQSTLATRFNVAAFGCLGYELDLKFLTKAQLNEIKDQVAFYRKHRQTLQYGSFFRYDELKDNKVVWHCVDQEKKEGLSGFFQTMAKAGESFDRLRFIGLSDNAKYKVETRPQRLFIKQFGGLVKHIFPLTLNPDGFILRNLNKFYTLIDCVETYEAYGRTLNDGILLNNQFMGTYYNVQTRLLGDFGSNLYITTKIQE